jgi:hypothetical protein
MTAESSWVVMSAATYGNARDELFKHGTGEAPLCRKWQA